MTGAGYREEALVIGSRGALLGVLTRPDGAADPSRPVVIAVNAGLVHRVGPQRMHVTLLRRLARLGFTCLRFDFSGIGDSLPRTDLLPYTRSTLEELREAMDAVTERTGLARFCVAGLSSGALVAMASASADARVAGVCMLNPHGFGASSLWGEHVEAVYTHRVYLGNLASLASWRKFLTGRTDYRRLLRTLRYRLGMGLAPDAAATELAATVQGARPELIAFFQRGLPTLIVFSQRDRSLQNFEEILGRGWRRRLGKQVKLVEIPGANHTFASPEHLKQALQAIEGWLVQRWPALPPAPQPSAALQSSRTVNSAPGGQHGF
jgi:pimeloyl-ACP methyl ester carboxylesterase